MTARLLMAVLIPITLWGCSEIKEEPVLPPDDDFDGIQKEFVLGAESEGLPVSHVTVTLLSETGTLFSREARAEELEEVEKTKEIVHTVIAGVAVATSTIALLAGEVATGGAATALIAVGAYASIVGGLNAVIKSCTKFETNAVIISQCVNGGTVTAGNKDNVGSIAGRLCDGSLIYDCLNAVADNNHEEFAADFNTMCSATHCISLIEHPLFSTDGELENCVFVTTDPRNDQISSEGMTFVSTNDMSASGTFSKLGFSIGDSGRWKIMAGVPFPIPNYSEMQK